MSLNAGARLGSYEIVGPIGAGGMGEVYKARDTKLHRDVALKILPEHCRWQVRGPAGMAGAARHRHADDQIQHCFLASRRRPRSTGNQSRPGVKLPIGKILQGARV